VVFWAARGGKRAGKSGKEMREGMCWALNALRLFGACRKDETGGVEKYLLLAFNLEKKQRARQMRKDHSVDLNVLE